MRAQRNDRAAVTMYSEADEDDKVAAAKRVLDLRNENPPKTYKECTEIIKREFGIEVTRKQHL